LLIFDKTETNKLIFIYFCVKLIVKAEEWRINMNKRYLLLVLITGIALFAFSCKTNTINMAPDTKLNDTLSITGKMAIKSSNNNLSGGFVLDIEKQNQIRMDIYAAFGIQVFHLSADSSRFNAIDIWNKVIYTGNISSTNIEKVLQMPVSVKMLINIILRKSLVPYELLIYENDNTNIIKSYVNDNINYTSINNFTTKKDSSYYRQGNNELVIKYSGKEQKFGLKPEINISIPRNDLKTEITIKEVLSDKFRVKNIKLKELKDYKIIDLDTIEQ
jgi:hypothetical protein